jgi:hypothetical protein
VLTRQHNEWPVTTRAQGDKKNKNKKRARPGQKKTKPLQISSGPDNYDNDNNTRRVVRKSLTE